MITGASSGIGKATATGLAKIGMRVVVVCRNPSRGEAAVNEIKSKSGNDSVLLMLADLSSQGAIRQLARDFKDRYSRLDLLINNAVVFTHQRTLTVDGIETQFAINHLSYFLLTNLLLDLLKSSSPSRIVNVASSAERFGRINLEDLGDEKGYNGYRAYNRSKLANLLFTYELAKRLKGTGVSANCLHPGVVITALGRKNMVGFHRFVRLVAISAEKAAATPIYLAASPEVEGVSGKYFIKEKETKSSKKSYDESLGQRLWKLSEELTRSSKVESNLSL